MAQPVNPAYIRSDGILVFVDDHGEYCRVPLSQNKFASIDIEDADKVYPWTWSAQWNPGCKRFRASGRVPINGEMVQIYLHRFVMDAPLDLHVDHVDGDQLNDRKYNLRLASYPQNLSNRTKQKNNTTGFKGVHWDKKRQKFTSQIQAKGVLRHLGGFSSAEEAFEAYCEAGKILHGEFFCTDETRNEKINNQPVSLAMAEYEDLIGRKSRGWRRAKKRPNVTQPDNPDHKLIALTRGMVTLVDAKNYHDLMRWPWQASWSRTTKSFYPLRSDGVSMGRYIMNAPKGSIVDHIDHDTLCHLESNLRVVDYFKSIANTRQRSDNSSGYKGVHLNNGKWRAAIRSEGDRRHLGYFETPELAYEAYCKAALELHGEFACLG